MLNMSVIIPCFNSSEFIKQTVNSVASQCFNGFEIIIVNDGSTDQTGQIAEDLKRSVRCVTVIHQKNLGVLKAFLNGVAVANGKYIVRIDADDLMLPNRLAMQFNWMELNRHVDAAGSWYYRFRNELIPKPFIKLPVSPGANKLFFCFHNQISNPTSVVRKDVFLNYKLPDVRIGEDLALWLSLITDGRGVANMPFPTTWYRVHSNQATAKNKISEIKLATDAVYERFKDCSFFKEHMNFFNAGLMFRNGSLDILLLDELLTNLSEYLQPEDFSLGSDATAAAVGRLYFGCRGGYKERLIGAHRKLHSLGLSSSWFYIFLTKAITRFNG